MNCTPNKKKKFQYPVDRWGIDLQSEHERYLVEKHFKKPVIVTDYPRENKAFYMRVNPDGKTVACHGHPRPRRRRNYRRLTARRTLRDSQQRALNLRFPRKYLVYLDIRKYGSVVHSGFGLGFERLLMFITGMGNVRDVSPFPRTPKSAEF
jgi:asparaginyl-tRNA synthetase